MVNSYTKDTYNARREKRRQKQKQKKKTIFSIRNNNLAGFSYKKDFRVKKKRGKKK